MEIIPKLSMILSTSKNEILLVISKNLQNHFIKFIYENIQQLNFFF